MSDNPLSPLDLYEKFFGFKPNYLPALARLGYTKEDLFRIFTGNIAKIEKTDHELKSSELFACAVTLTHNQLVGIWDREDLIRETQKVIKWADDEMSKERVVGVLEGMRRRV
jgi:hypothetical protein